MITGSAGLIGSRLTQYLLDNTDYTIIGVDNMFGSYHDNIPKSKRVITFCMDVESDELKSIFQQYDIEYVFHFAAYAAECVSPFIRKYNYVNNLIATANVINCCINYNVKRLIFTSSMAVYGNQSIPFDESLFPCPVDPYGVAKYACEMDIKIAGEQHGLDWCIIRPHNVYGRNQNLWDSYRNFIGICMYKLLNHDPITIYGDGLQTRAFSYIDDCLSPLWTAATSERASKQIINLGGKEEISILTAAQTVINTAGYGDIIHLEPRDEVRHAWSTWEKSETILGYNQSTSFQDGIYDMWQWAKEQPNRPRFIWPIDEYEVIKKLYTFWNPETLKNGYWKSSTVK